MGQVSKGWMIWGIIAIILVSVMFVVICFMSLAVNNLTAANNQSFSCVDGLKPICAKDPAQVKECATGQTAVCFRDINKAIECEEGTKTVCMKQEDYKKIYG